MYVEFVKLKEILMSFSDKVFVYLVLCVYDFFLTYRKLTKIIRNILTVLIYSGMFGNDINVIAMGGRLKCKTIHGPVLYLCSRNGLLSLNLSLDCIIRFGIANTTNL